MKPKRNHCYGHTPQIQKGAKTSNSGVERNTISYTGCLVYSPLVVLMSGLRSSCCLDVWFTLYVVVWMSGLHLFWLSECLVYTFSGCLDVWFTPFLVVWMSGLHLFWLSGCLVYTFSGCLDVWFTPFLVVWMCGLGFFLLVWKGCLIYAPLVVWMSGLCYFWLFPCLVYALCGCLDVCFFFICSHLVPQTQDISREQMFRSLLGHWLQTRRPTQSCFRPGQDTHTFLFQTRTGHPHSLVSDQEGHPHSLVSDQDRTPTQSCCRLGKDTHSLVAD